MPTSTHRNLLLSRLAPLPLLLAAVGAQTPLPPAQQAVAQVHAAPAPGPNMPPPSRRAQGYEGPTKVFTPVPAGDGTLAQPASPPTPAQPAQGSPQAPCDFRFFLNNAVNPSGASIINTTVEPNVAVQGDGVLYTGNWFAARSSDSGMTWARYAPTTFFPASDGGFCCDQRALVVRNPDMVIWLLEYGYSATTQQGRLRVAFTRTTTDLKNDSFYYFDITPGMLGQPAGRFLDYSDIAYSNGYLYGSAIVASPPATAQGLVLWRAGLFDIWDLGGVGIGYYTSATLGGYGSYRFAQGSTDPMYFAVHTSTTNLRVFRWADSSGAASQFDRTVTAWSGTPTAAAGPDGRDWTGFQYTVNCVLSGYARSGEVGFLWTSGAIPPGRPQMFVRVARLRTSDMTLVGQDDIWSRNQAWHFPTCATNAAGEVGGTIAVGGGTLYPSTAAFLVDQCSPGWAPLNISIFASGARGPASNRWGDYLGAARHSVVTNTFVGGGYALDSSGNAVPRFAWFGRERDEPGWVDASITASDGSVAIAANMTVFQTDRLGRKDGTTPFARSYPPRQALIVTAPLVTGFNRFSHWIYQGVAQPAGQLTLNVGDLGTGPRSVVAEARYIRFASLIVDSRPITGVPITVGTTDLNGRGNGVTRFIREYRTNTLVSLTAPAQMGQNAFRYWVVNGIPQQPNQTTVAVSTAANVLLFADYGGTVGNGMQWRDVTANSPVVPPARYDAGLAFHPATGRMVMFGGGSTVGPLNDTWLLDGDVWSQATPATAPAARNLQAMTLDVTTGQVLMFGGQNRSGVRLGETWAWNGADWTRLTPATSPSPRFAPAMAHDPVTGRMLLFGGNVLSGAFGSWVSETWSFDGSTWTRLAPVHSPSSPSYPMLARDSGRGRLVLTVAPSVGGLETWEWSGSDWVAHSPATSPPTRTSTSLVHDPLRGKSTLFAGSAGFTQLRDIWEWSGSTWVQRFTATAPSARLSHAMAYDPIHHRAVLFGGFSGAFTVLGDTWAYDFACEVVGEGHPGGGLAITCTSAPRIGTNLCLEFLGAQGTGALSLGLSAPMRPPLPLGPPSVCAPGSLFAFPHFTLPANGNPGTACIPIPADNGLIGAVVTVQGLALAAAGCLQLTDAMAVILQP